MSDWFRIHADDGVDLASIAGTPSSLEWIPEYDEYFVAWQSFSNGTVILVVATGVQSIDDVTPRSSVKTLIRYLGGASQRLGASFELDYTDRREAWGRGVLPPEDAILAVARHVAATFDLPDDGLESLGKKPRKLNPDALKGRD
jgi:hypothetical protein